MMKNPKKYGPALLCAVHHKKETVRLSAIEVLWKIKLKQGIPHIISALKDKSWLVQLTAAETIRDIGPKAKKAIPILLKMLNARDAHNVLVKESVLSALLALNTNSSILLPRIIRILGSKSIKAPKHGMSKERIKEHDKLRSIALMSILSIVSKKTPRPELTRLQTQLQTLYQHEKALKHKFEAVLWLVKKRLKEKKNSS